MDPGAERAARNEALFRETNERIEVVATGFDLGRFEALCECADAGCTDMIEMSRDEYEAVRGRGDRFAMTAGHDDPTIERVVEQTDRFVVVEKLGEGAGLARALDPRAE